MASPRDAELKYKAKLEAEARRRDLEDIVKLLVGKRVSPRLLESLNVANIESLTREQLDNLRYILSAGGEPPEQIPTTQLPAPQPVEAIDMRDLVSTIVNDVKDNLTKSLIPHIVTAVKEAGVGGEPASRIAADRPTIEKVFIDPSDHIKVESNIKGLGTETTGANIANDIETFRLLKKGKGKPNE